MVNAAPFSKPEPNPTELPESINVSELDAYTREVMEHFGLNAASVLNTYCTELEDAVLQLVQYNKQLQQELNELTNDSSTNP